MYLTRMAATSNVGKISVIRGYMNGVDRTMTGMRAYAAGLACAAVRMFRRVRHRTPAREIRTFEHTET